MSGGREKKRKAEEVFPPGPDGSGGSGDGAQRVHDAFAGAAAAVSLLYTAALHERKRAHVAGQRHALDVLRAWALSRAAQGQAAVSTVELAASLEREATALEREDVDLLACAPGVGDAAGPLLGGAAAASAYASAAAAPPGPPQPPPHAAPSPSKPMDSA